MSFGDIALIVLVEINNGGEQKEECLKVIRSRFGDGSCINEGGNDSLYRLNIEEQIYYQLETKVRCHSVKFLLSSSCFQSNLFELIKDQTILFRTKPEALRSFLDLRIDVKSFAPIKKKFHSKTSVLNVFAKGPSLAAPENVPPMFQNIPGGGDFNATQDPDFIIRGRRRSQSIPNIFAPYVSKN